MRLMLTEAQTQGALLQLLYDQASYVTPNIVQLE
jgi:hypothetical protein